MSIPDYHRPVKRWRACVAVLLIMSVIAVPFAVAASASARTTSRSGASPAVPIAAAVTTVTGIAISPLLGTGLYGAYQWFAAHTAEERAALPWYSQIKFWLPALLIVGI